MCCIPIHVRIVPRMSKTVWPRGLCTSVAVDLYVQAKRVNFVIESSYVEFRSLPPRPRSVVVTAIARATLAHATLRRRARHDDASISSAFGRASLNKAQRDSLEKARNDLSRFQTLAAEK